MKNRALKPIAVIIFAVAVLLTAPSLVLAVELPEGFVHVQNEIPSVTAVSGTSGVTQLPSRYDLREYDRVTPVRDQGDYGCCWAFAMIAAAESSIITKNPGISVKPDFSELHLIYYSYSKNGDPLGNTKGDYVKLFPSAPNFLDLGGNLYGATFTLAKWVGVADESVLPYTLADRNMSVSGQYEYTASAHLENADWIDMGDISGVKRAIMSTGAVAVPYYSDDKYLNFSTNAYYCDSILVLPTMKNHAAAIIGWDDSYPRKNFGGVIGIGKRPSSDGAWLVRNSYGADYGDGGYIWISYEDCSLEGSAAVSTVFAPADNYDYNYQYDGGQSYSYYESSDSAHMANVFTASGDEILKAVSFYTTEVNEGYDVSIYTEITGSDSPTDGKYEASAHTGGSFESAGYHTVKLPKPVALIKGEKFSVVVRLSSEGKTVKLLSDSTAALGIGMYNITDSSPGQSFISSDGKSWQDLCHIGLKENFRIKAFTDSGRINVSSVSLNANAVTLTPGGKRALAASVTPVNATGGVTWSSSNSSVAKVSSNGLITAVSFGSCTITAKAQYGSRTAACTVTVVPKAVTGLSCSNVDETSLTLKWNSVSGASKYQIYRYDSAAGKYVYFRSVTATLCNIGGLSAGQRLQYRVRAVHTKASKNYYGAFSPVCYAATVRRMSSSLSVSGYSDTSVNLKWQAAPGVSGYRVYMYTGTLKSARLVRTVTTVSCSVTGLSANTKYFFKVCAYIKTGGSVYTGRQSNIVTAITGPAAPKKLSVKSATASEVTLSWSAAADATGYVVYKNVGKGWERVGATKKTVCTVRGLSESTEYTFCVRAYKSHPDHGNSYSVLSNICKTRTAPL